MHLQRIIAVAALAVITLAADAQQVVRSIEPVAQDLYRVTSGHYHTMYWVTPAGIVLFDPIDADTARWLKAEVAERHAAPVRYVIYSHNHPDHVYGGEVFDDPRTIFIAHERAREDLVRTRAATRIPELAFSDQLTLNLDGKTLRLRYHGPNNGRGSISIHFVDARVMFVVDWIVLGRMPYRDLPGYDIDGMIRSTREVLTLDWDTLVGGHAQIGDRKAVERYLAYLEALYTAVRDGMLAGKPLEDLQKEIRLDEFKDLANYEAWLPLNIAGVYRTLADQSYLPTRTDVPRQPE